MRSLILPYKAERKALLCRAQQADITVKPIALGDPTPGTSCHNARPPDLPPGLPCLQAHRMRLCGCFTYYPSLHMFRCRVCTTCRTGQLHSCVYCSVCMCVRLSACLKREGGGIHQISYLIWAASGRSERSRGEAFISETGKKRDRIKME